MGQLQGRRRVPLYDGRIVGAGLARGGLAQQEGQHGIVHSQYNDRLKRQGIDVDRLEAIQHYMMFDLIRKYLPAKATLADTAASEHLTSTMAEALFEKGALLGRVDHRMRALYAWHAMEELEHKAVAFDVMKKVAKVGYLSRILSLLLVTSVSFFAWTLLTIAIKAPERMGEQLPLLAAALVLFLVTSQGVQSIRGFRAATGVLVGITLILAIVGILQGATPKICIVRTMLRDIAKKALASASTRILRNGTPIWTYITENMAANCSGQPCSRSALA